jgi:hypothetical protein
MERSFRRFAAAALTLAATALTSLTQDASAQELGAQPNSGSSSNARSGASSDARERLTGLTLGVYSLAAAGVSISGPDIKGTFKTQLGEGAGIVAGWGFNRTLSAYASLDVAKQATAPHTHPDGTFGLAHFEIGVRANLPMSSARTIPYVSASIGHRALAANVYNDNVDENVDFAMSGQSYVVGGGIEHFISPHVALDGGVELATGTFGHFSDNTGQYDVKLNSSTSTRLRVGVNWRP